MQERLLKFKLRIQQELKKDKIIPWVVVLCATLITIFFSQKSSTQKTVEESDLFGAVIPKGMLIVPIQLENSAGLEKLIQRQGVIDVFAPGKELPIAENLRIIKLDPGEGPVFGALVPQESGRLFQEVFSLPTLKGAMKNTNSPATRFHLQDKVTRQKGFQEIQIQEG